MTKAKREEQLRNRCRIAIVGIGLALCMIPVFVAPAEEQIFETEPTELETEWESIRWKQETEEKVSIEPMEEIIVAEPEQTEPEHISYEVYVETICKEYGICPEVVLALIEAESGGDPNAVSDHGAIGLMQVVHRFHWDRMERLGVTDLYDPYSNILVGVDFLAELFDKYHELPIVLMCYNEGEYDGAPESAMAGNISDYAKKIMIRASELQEDKNEEL